MGYGTVLDHNYDLHLHTLYQSYLYFLKITKIVMVWISEVMFEKFQVLAIFVSRSYIILVTHLEVFKKKGYHTFFP
jgi:hypothetical protein